MPRLDGSTTTSTLSRGGGAVKRRSEPFKWQVVVNRRKIISGAAEDAETLGHDLLGCLSGLFSLSFSELTSSSSSSIVFVCHHVCKGPVPAQLDHVFPQLGRPPFDIIETRLSLLTALQWSGQSTSLKRNLITSLFLLARVIVSSAQQHSGNAPIVTECSL